MTEDEVITNEIDPEPAKVYIYIFGPTEHPLAEVRWHVLNKDGTVLYDSGSKRDGYKESEEAQIMRDIRKLYGDDIPVVDVRYEPEPVDMESVQAQLDAAYEMARQHDLREGLPGTDVDDSFPQISNPLFVPPAPRTLISDEERAESEATNARLMAEAFSHRHTTDIAPDELAESAKVNKELEIAMGLIKEKDEDGTNNVIKLPPDEFAKLTGGDVSA